VIKGGIAKFQKGKGALWGDLARRLENNGKKREPKKQLTRGGSKKL